MISESEIGSPDKRVVVVVSLAVIVTLLALLTAYTKYIYAKEYNFLVEAPCNPEEMTCYVRDCSDYCPPNELEIYKTYQISATDYSSCTTNSCVNVCENENTKDRCVPIICDINNDDDCTS